MKLDDFLRSDWARAAARPDAESRVRSAFPNWLARLKNLQLAARARELWSYFISEYCSATDKLLVLAALIYLISPIDLVPDAIPVAGWLDDLGVAGAVLAFLGGKLDEHKLRQEMAGTDNDSVSEAMTRAEPNVLQSIMTDFRNNPFSDIISDRGSLGVWETLLSEKGGGVSELLTPSNPFSRYLKDDLDKK